MDVPLAMETAATVRSVPVATTSFSATPLPSTPPGAELLQRIAATVRRPLQPIAQWIGRSLGRRFVIGSLGLLLVVQLASFLVIDASMQRHARKALPEQLAMGENALRRLLDWRSQRLIEGARLLAADYGFRSAVQSNDHDTIASVLANHGARIGASEVALLGTDFEPIAIAEGSSWKVAMAAAGIVRLAPEASKTGGATRIVVIGSVARQMVLVPLKAPLLVGWVVMCFPLPASIADDVHKLSGTDLTVLSRTGPSAPWSVDFSRLEPAASAEIARGAWPDDAVKIAAQPGMTEIRFGAQRLGTHVMPLTAPDMGGDGQPAEILTVFSVPVDELLRTPRDMQFALLVTTLLAFVAFGLGSVYNARRITTPLQGLAAAAERLGSGDSTTPIRAAGGHDEVGELADAFEQMRLRLANNQEQIVQSEKLASIGQLAAGVAHEINNPIGFVFSNFGTLEDYLARLFRMLQAYRESELALAGSPEGRRLANLREEIELEYLHEDIPALMSESRDGLKRVRKIVQDLKDFSHVDHRREWETVDLHVGLDSTLNIVGNEIKYKAEVVKEYGDLPAIECLPNELNQVFMNLLVNAAHAIGTERGRITLRTSLVDTNVCIEIADNGCGIAPADMKRIFDPFFTTKPVGKGTGLGLSLSYGIVKTHGGRIEVTSEPGRGTTFRVWLPVRRAVTSPPTATDPH